MNEMSWSMNCSVAKSTYAKKIALYLAYRYRIRVDPSAVPNDLERLMDVDQLEEKAYFHNAVSDLFQISLASEFRIQKYFGAIGEANQMLRDIELHILQGIDDFLVATRDLLYRFFHFRARAIEQNPAGREVGFPDDDELTSLINDLEPKSDGTHKWKNGKQTFLLDQLRRVMRKYLMEVQEKEGLIVRDKMFVSYSHDDEKWRDMLLTAIYSHFGQDPPIWYYAENAEFSDDIEEEILKARSETKVAILLTRQQLLCFISDYETGVSIFQRATGPKESPNTLDSLCAKLCGYAGAAQRMDTGGD